MLEVLYAITQLVELSIGVYVIYKVYPEWRWNTGITKVLFGIGYIIIAILYIGNSLDSYISNIFVIGSGLEIGLLYCVFFKGRLWSVCLWQMLYNINLAILKLPMMIMYGMYEQKKLGEINRGGIQWGMLIWCVVIDIALVYMAGRIHSWVNWIQSILRYKRKLLLVLVIVEWSLLTYNMWLGEQGFQSVDLIINLMLIISVSMATQALALYIVFKNNKSEKTILDTAQNLVQNHHYVLEDLYERNKKSLHDVKHHMLTIAGYLESKEFDKAKKVVNIYLGDLEENSYHVWTGFSFLDYIINYKKSQMNENGIEFTLEVELFEYPFEDGEMGVVLGNLLDNAIEAAKQCVATKRKIAMRLQTRNNMFVLNIKNSIVEIPKKKQDKFITSKENKNAHGLGVENVKRIVEKYGGSIDFQYDNEQFEVTILI